MDSESAVGPPTMLACTTALARAAERDTSGWRVVELGCAGRVNAGAILEAVEQGAGRVFVVGCQESSCRHLDGARLARQQVALARRLLGILGFDPSVVALELVDRAGTATTDTELQALGCRCGN